MGSAKCTLVVALSALAGCGPVAVAQPKPAPSRSGSLEVVMAGPPTRKTLTLVTAQPARIEPIEQTPIHSKLAAYVSELHADYGDRVKKDQALVTLAAPELDAELAQKQALLEQAQAEMRQGESAEKAAQAAVLTAKSQVAETQARLEKTEADVRTWKLKCDRFRNLVSGGSINQQLVEETEQSCHAAEAANKEALAAIQSAQAVVAQSESLVAKAAADVEAAKARVRVAEANLSHIEALRSYLTIRAPYDGVITERHVDLGHFVQPASGNGTLLLKLCRTDQMRVFAAIPEAEAGYVDVGDAVMIDVPALRGSGVQGQVTRTSVALDAGSRSLLAIVDLDNADGKLRPGMYATIKLTLQEQANVLTLPSAAVIRRGNDAFCYRLVDGKATETPIQLGIRVEGDWEVVGGIAVGDTVILNKASSLQNGQAVEVLKSGAG